MTTLEHRALPAHPLSARPGDAWLDTRLAPLAAELVGAVRDLGPDDVDRVLTRIPDGQDRDFVLLLAAMIDPDRSPADLLAWTTTGPVPSRPEVPRQFPCPDCGRPVHAKHTRRHRERHHPDLAERDRLIAAGVNPQAAEVLAARNDTQAA